MKQRLLHDIWVVLPMAVYLEEGRPQIASLSEGDEDFSTFKFNTTPL